MRKILLPALFFIFTPFTLAISFFALWQVSPSNIPAKVSQNKEILGSKAPLELYSALPPAIGTISHKVDTHEARPIIIAQFLEENSSPIVSYAETIFQISQKYNLDYRLMIAIAMCESNLCKKIPEGSYNCWGFENGETRFLSWEQAFERVAKTLKEGYIDQGLTTPDLIMPKYAPPSVEKGGPWAKCVNQYFGELE